MHIDLVTGLLQGVRYAASPNWDERPVAMRPEVLIIHAISLPPGEFGGPYVEQLFLNHIDPQGHPSFEGLQDLKVSAHVFLRRDGEIIQFVPLHGRAWHAGESLVEGRTRVNDFSIGIELEGDDDTAFEEIQYQVLAQLTHVIQQAYPEITAERLYGHSDIAPERKTDPGPFFDWVHYRTLLAELNSGTA